MVESYILTIFWSCFLGWLLYLGLRIAQTGREVNESHKRVVEASDNVELVFRKLLVERNKKEKQDG